MRFCHAGAVKMLSMSRPASAFPTSTSRADSGAHGRGAHHQKESARYAGSGPREAREALAKAALPCTSYKV